MQHDSLRAVALAALLVLAGCTFGGQPSATPSGTATNTPGAASATATATPGDEVAANFETDYDPQLVLERVERMRGLEATGAVKVYRYDIDVDVENGWEEDKADRFAGIHPSGATALQLYSTADAPAAQPLGYADRRRGSTVVNVMGEDGLELYNTSQEAVLAHEFVHALQIQQDLIHPDRSMPNLTDALLARSMLVEGHASLVEQRYADRHGLEGLGVATRNETGERAEWSTDLFSIAYYYGYRYAKTADGWGERTERIRRPRARTTATMLHPGLELAEPGEAVPSPAVDGLNATRRDRVGELVVRFSLRTNGVPFGEAAAAGAGWRNDSMVYYEDTPAVYWGTRWANASEAREFEDAWRDMLDRRGATTDDGLLVVPATEDAPRTYYAVERSGSVVHVAAGQNRTAVERVADAW